MPQTVENFGLPKLPENSARTIHSIETGEILGASLTIRLINEVFCQYADANIKKSGAELAADIQVWAKYLIATRGALSPAVGNAIHLLLKGLDKAAQGSGEEVRQFIHRQTQAYNRQSLERVNKIAQFGANLLAQAESVMAYDYSSSVTAVLIKAAEMGKKLHVYIPESRALDGGKPIVRDILNCGHRITFTVDVAMGQELKKCDAVLVGVESLTIDGGFWTTVGTGSLAILAAYHRVPFYVPTELIKLDLRSIEGIHRQVTRTKLPMLSLQGLEPLPADLLIECDDLEYTPRELITAYITEKGILPPSAIASSVEELLIDPV